MSDARTDYIVSILAKLFFGQATLKQIQDQVGDNKEITAFLDDASVNILRVTCTAGEHTVLKFSNALKADPKDDVTAEASFVKLKPEAVSKDDIAANILVSALNGSPVQSLYHALHSLYAPLLLTNSGWADYLDRKSQTLLADLEDSLGNVVRRGMAGGTENIHSELAIAAILTPTDEFKLWDSLTSVTRYSAIANIFNDSFEEVSSRYAKLQDLNLSDVIELIDETQNVLDDIWKAEVRSDQRYPQPRMVNLFIIIAKAFNRYIQSSLSKVNIWTGPFSEVRTKLRESIKVCEMWVDVSSSLTSTFWPTHDEHPWMGEPYKEEALKDLQTRLDEILRIRTTHEELLRLMSTSEQKELHVERPLEAFQNQEALHCNPYTQPRWQSAVAEYERLLEPIERDIARKLRTNVAGLGDRPQQLLREFLRYNNLLKRKNISREMRAERETLLAQLSAFIEQLDSTFENRSMMGPSPEDNPPSGNNMPEVSNNIMWVNQIYSKADEILNTASSLLHDITAFEDFKNSVTSLLDKIRIWKKEEVEKWREEVEEAMDDKELTLELSGKLMEISKEGDLVVNYSERLVQLLREVRQLTELGFDVGRKIRKVAENAEKFYRHGVRLKKVANFYNTMESQIIEVQLPMLLENLKLFEDLVSEPRTARGNKEVQWDNPRECANFVEKAQRAAEQLSGDNRKLRKIHQQFADDVVSLMEIDLLRQRDKWKAKWTKMEDMMERLSRKYKAQLMVKFRKHWDHQVYKALECSYRMGLESLNEFLPEMKCELVFSQKRLQFRPPLEELKAQYYRSVKRFISIPNNFDGFGNKAIFRTMSDVNGDSLNQVYVKSEQLFESLAKLRDGNNQNWVALGTISNLDDYVEEHVKEVEDYTTNFDMLKKQGKKLEKLPDFYKEGCFLVSSTAFKSAAEDQMNSLNDALLICLKTSLMKQLTEVEEFLDKSMERLNTRPHSIEEIGLAKKEWQGIDEFKREIRTMFKKSEAKRQLLMSVAGNRVDTEEVRQRLATLPNRWENFEISLEAFNDMVEEQREGLKGEVDKSVMDCNMKLTKLSQRWHALKPKAPEEWSKEALDKIFEELDGWNEEAENIEELANTLCENCEHFEMPIPRFEGLDPLKEDMELVLNMWGLMRKYMEQLNEKKSQDWITFRTRLFELNDFVTKWMKEIKVQKNEVTSHIRDELHKLQKAIPALKNCKGDVPFNTDHWRELFRKLKIPKSVKIDTLTLGHFIDVLDNVVKHERWCRNLTARATGEVRIREAMGELREWAADREFTLFEHEELGRTTMLISEWKDLFTELGDQQSLLSSLTESPYFKPFQAEGEQFETNYGNLDYYLHNLNTIQRKWLYLEPIFERGALPQEQARWKRVDEIFVEIQSKVANDPKVMSLCDTGIHENMKDDVDLCSQQLERCQKALSDYLEEKRSLMPRFYFIGDEDLLEILGQAKNPEVIQSHLKKLFQGVHTVNFNESKSEIIAINSSAGESVPLKASVILSDNVELWLTDLVDKMKDSLAKITCDLIDDKDADMDNYPSQILCLGAQVHFTVDCEKAIKESTLPVLLEKLTGTLKGYTSQQIKAKLLRKKVMSLLMDLMHLIDVVNYLITDKIQTLSVWGWTKQLRYYNLDSGELAGKCVARMVDSQLNYTYEYQGNAGKLVHTPLTDKCYLTLSQGMHQGYGGNPYGPAGTGKTESVKALGAALGRQVLVFNCDEGIDFQSMGRIFTGLTISGAWGCFDEFNRLKADQLSAVSQQIQVIQDAIKDKIPSAVLLGKKIHVDFNAGIFVTMNPASKKYQGRSKLPDNLKALFRPISMSRPDNDLIAEVMLYANGFQAAKKLSTKVVSVFTLSSELLSPQQHYDWGLRALKAILVTGGKLILSSKDAGMEVTDLVEADLLVKSLRVNTLSKLTFDDAKRFVGLCSDIFPEVEAEDIQIPELQAAIKETMESKEFNLIFDKTQMLKMLQLKESLAQRMGCVIVGPSGCGKTVVWKVLAEAMRKCGQKLKCYVMNPKAMPRQQLLGFMDNDTREWNDGVLTEASKNMVKEDMDTTSWLICDGDVDAEWIESLNSVLDDNHLLTLPNGERINFGPNINFLFETHDLQFASPATISRMGMIFLSEKDVDINKTVTKWIEDLPKEMHAQMQLWVDDYLYKAIDEVLATEPIVETTMVGTVMCGLSQCAEATSKGEFVMGLIKGLGGNLNIEQRCSFAKKVFSWAGERPPNISKPLDCKCEKGRFIGYQYEEPTAQLNKKALDGGLVIRTVSLQRNLDMFQGWFDRKEPFIIVGPQGCGKSMMMNHIFRKRKGTTVATLDCSSQTTAMNVIQKIQASCTLVSTTAGRVYRPREGDRVVLFLKDINLPKPDQYNTCMLIAFLQQLLTFDGFYDKNLEFLRIENVQIVCSMNPSTTVGRHPLSTRFTAIVRIGYVDYPTKDELTQIYGNYLQAALSDQEVSDQKWRDKSNLKQLAKTMIEIFQKVTSKFSVDDHRHYLFTPRELTKWIMGLFTYDLGKEDLLDVFAYEGGRLMRDRLVDAESEKKFDGFLNGVLNSQWSHRPDIRNAFFTTMGVEPDEDDDAETKGPSSGGAKRLKRVDLTEFQEICKQGLISFEREEKELGILLFTEILDHLVRVDRVLARDGGSLLLIGRSGVGRATAAQIVAHMLGMEFNTPIVSRGYTTKKFFETIKHCFEHAGIEGEHTVLYIEDHQMEKSFVLETVNSILSSGDVPGLYTHEELAPLIDPLKEIMEEESAFEFRNPYEFFISRVRKRLHVCLGMDPTNDLFKTRCQSNPALFTSCEIIWMGSWKKESMVEVPAMLLPSLMAEADDDQLSRHCVNVHESVASSTGGIFADIKLTATPRDFISFLNCYQALYNNTRDALLGRAKRMSDGLKRLQDAAATVDELNKNANVQRKELAEKQEAADTAMVEITESISISSERKLQVTTLTEKLNIASAQLAVHKDKIENELAEVKPLVAKAQKAVSGIKKKYLDELKALKMPPQPVQHVLGAVLTMLGQKDLSWKAIKSKLKPAVVTEIMNYDIARLTKSVRKKIGKIMKKNAESFKEERIKKVSVACAPMAIWVSANVRYANVMEQVEPLTQQLEAADRELQESQAKLEQNQVELKELEEKVAKLKADFGKRTAEAERLKAALAETEKIVNKATNLLDKLTGERARWEVTVKELNEAVKTLPVKIMMAAAYTTYLGKAAEDVRANAVKIWRNLTNTKKFDYTSLLSSESQLLSFKKDGLPSDVLSMENAVIILNGHQRFSFIIDPSGKATAWLRTHLDNEIKKAGNRQLEVITSADERFQNKTELAVRFGKTLVLLEVDGIEPMLVPLVRRDCSNNGSRKVVQIGQKQVDFNENFQLYLVTRNPSPYLPPDSKSIINEINFSVTRAGLEGQLLGVTLQNEKPELEKQKSAMLQKEEGYKLQLAKLENDLLEALAASTGSLLENEPLIQILTQTKQAAAEIKEALKESEVASVKLDAERNAYRPFAADATCLFFLVQQLQSSNHMYQFSLAAFVNLFKLTLTADLKSDSIEERLTILTPDLEHRVLFFVGRGLFKADQLMFAMHLVHGMRAKDFAENEWECFVGDIVDTSKKEPSGFPPWANPDRMSAFRLLDDNVGDFVSNLDLLDKGTWKKYARSAKCEQEFPAKLAGSCTKFQQLLVCQCLRPDRLQSAIEKYACETLKLESIAPPAMNLAKIVDLVDSDTPILMITTTGMDPTKAVALLANEMVGAKNFDELALGGGQQKAALDLLKQARKKGTWLCLKNLHLLADWLPEFEKALNNGKAHDDFRLWLTTEAHHRFPPILLQQSLKVTFESPPGIKKNMQSTYENWKPEYISAGSKKRAQILFILAFFHALIQERRNYIPQGWTEFYEFSTSDLRVAANCADAILKNNNNDMKWPLLHGMIENALYGGRISDPYDNRVLAAYFTKYFRADMLSGDIMPGYSVPDSNSHADFVKFIASFPDSDGPEIFGLPANIERAKQRMSSSLLINQLQSLGAAGGSGGGGGFNREKWKAVLGPALGTWEKLAQDPAALSEQTGPRADHNATPVQSFVQLEMDNAVKLVKIVNSDVMAIKSVVYGTGMLTPAIQTNAETMIVGWVPGKWEKMWEGPEAPLPWLKALIMRKIALKTWMQECLADKLLNDVPLRLNELLHPGTFLNAVRQQTARVSKQPLDSLVMISCFDKKLIEKCPLYIRVQGLFMQGALFEESGLQPAGPDSNEIITVKDAYIAYVPPDTKFPYSPDTYVMVPIYYNTLRERLLTQLAVPMTGRVTDWIQAGVALFLDQ